jgi:hypothetical protein
MKTHIGKRNQRNITKSFAGSICYSRPKPTVVDRFLADVEKNEKSK